MKLTPPAAKVLIEHMQTLNDPAQIVSLGKFIEKLDNDRNSAKVKSRFQRHYEAIERSAIR